MINDLFGISKAHSLYQFRDSISDILMLMKTTAVSVQKEFCGECSLALVHFIGKMKGVLSIEPEEDRIVITFNESEITEEDLIHITRESIGKMGYKVE